MPGEAVPGGFGQAGAQGPAVRSLAPTLLNGFLWLLVYFCARGFVPGPCLPCSPLCLFAATARSPASIPAQGLNPVPSKVQHLPGKTGPPVCGSLSRNNTPRIPKAQERGTRSPAAPGGPLPQGSLSETTACHLPAQELGDRKPNPIHPWASEPGSKT